MPGWGNHNRKVRIIAESQDVTHGFAISEFNVNAVIEDFVANKKGEYDFVCSVYCGVGHSHMKGKLIVEWAKKEDLFDVTEPGV